MSRLVDARGLSCPQPVILVQKAMEEGEFPIEVLVDTVTTRENVNRVARSKGLTVEVIAEGEEFRLKLAKVYVQSAPSS